MAPSNDICYYGLHFGCLNADHNNECTRCAERLTHAVQRVLHPGQEAQETVDEANGKHTRVVANRRQDWHSAQFLVINQRD